MDPLWMRLCALLDDDPALAGRVAHARGGGDAEEWTALLDGLDDAGALAYLRADDTGVELADALAQLPRVFRADLDLDTVGDVDGDLEDAVRTADELLRAAALRIVHLAEEDDEDAVPLVVVAAADATEVVRLAGRVGGSARLFG